MKDTIKPRKMVKGEYYDIVLPSGQKLIDMQFTGKGEFKKNKPTAYQFRKCGGEFGDTVSYGISYMNQDNCIITQHLK